MMRLKLATPGQARRTRKLIGLVNDLRQQGVEFVSLRESLDTTTPGGKLVFHVFGAVAEFKRDVIRERTMGPRFETARSGFLSPRSAAATDVGRLRALWLVASRNSPPP